MKHLRLPHDGLVIRDVLLKTIIESNFSERDEIKTLEAGCGRKWALNSVKRRFKITGVDLDNDAYEIRKRRYDDIESFHHMSLEDYKRPNTFDFLYCVDVLEHCINTDTIINNLVDSLKPDGIGIIAFPHKNSFFGRLTYHTPHWLHIQFYKIFYKQKNAGTKGYGPYPVVYESILIPRNFEKKLSDLKVDMMYKITREYDYRRLGLWSYLYRFCYSILKIIFGRGIGDAGLIYVIKKSV